MGNAKVRLIYSLIIISVIVITISVSAFFIIRSTKEPEPVAMPELNEENCRHENVMKIPDKEIRQDFSSLCLRLGGARYKPSTPMNW